ncbi:RNA polymerase sigma factor [Nocardiopsis sp. NPDC058631]|uniref:RNA polymerase sigma factor n=1 Tax=Nocardiopsis sp. NPDC058631 TaxID=3346566 RepID=UPI0036524BEB
MSVSARTGPVPAVAEPPGPDTRRPGRTDTGSGPGSDPSGGHPPPAPGSGSTDGAEGEPRDGSAEDADLVRRALRGEYRAWEEIVDRHLPVVNAIARSYRLSGPDREDAVQAVWLTLNQHLPHLRSPGRLRAWLRRVTHRVCVRQRRTSSHHRALDPHDLAALPLPGASDPEAEYLRRERHEELHRAIRGLTDPGDRRAALGYLADPADSGTADRAAHPEGREGAPSPRAASNQRRRVLRRLRRLLEEPT